MAKITFDENHFRLLWLIYQHPYGISAQHLVEELKNRGWCEPDCTPESLGLEPDQILTPPRELKLGGLN